MSWFNTILGTGVRFTGVSTKNIITNLLISGDITNPIRYNADASNNYTSSAIDTTGNTVVFETGTSRNVTEKGEENARIHFGVGAQTVVDIFAKHGLDATKYALLCHDAWEEELDEEGNIIVEAGDRYGIRYDKITTQ